MMFSVFYILVFMFFLSIKVLVAAARVFALVRAEGLCLSMILVKRGRPVPGRGGGRFRCGDPVGIQTQDLQNRNLTLYSAKLRGLYAQCRAVANVNGLRRQS